MCNFFNLSPQILTVVLAVFTTYKLLVTNFIQSKFLCRCMVTQQVWEEEKTQTESRQKIRKSLIQK